MEDPIRRTLRALIADKGETLAELSRMLRRNPAYLHQYLHRGSPRRLAEEDRRLLARHFGVAEEAIGGRATVPESVAVPFLAVQAAAGSARAVEDERIVRHEHLAAPLLRELGVSPASASFIEARGDSMAPLILDGDRLLVDGADRRVGEGGAVFVLRSEDGLAVKRLTRHGRAIEVRSDNPAYETRRVLHDAIEVIGRVKLLMRRPG